MGDITKNFSFYEFRPKNKDKEWKPESEYQKILLQNLVGNLQVIRNEMPQGCYMKISSGVRVLQDYYRLTEAGYNPSKTSDHNCGIAIPLSPGSDKYNIFGETYNFSIGAADVIPVGMDVWELFKLSFRLVKENMCNFGQVIYETTSSGRTEWIHYGNPPEDFFSERIVKMIRRRKFLKSLDGGKTYSVVENI